MNIINRIIQYLDYKNISRYKFCKKMGVSNGFLNKSREISTDKYANILHYYPDINPEWLLTGKGNMLKDEKNTDYKADDDISNVAEEPTAAMLSVSSGNNNDRVLQLLEAQLKDKDKTIAGLEEIIKAKNELIEFLKNQNSPNNNTNKKSK